MRKPLASESCDPRIANIQKEKFMNRVSSLLIVLSITGSTLSSCQTNGSIVIGTMDSIYSNVLKENRKIWVYVPNLTNPSAPKMSNTAMLSSRRYPVVYLLDGEVHFYSVVGMIQQLSQANGNTICPEMIVVGIPNTDRTRDLTPTHAATGLYGDSAFDRTSGGGEKFTTFIEKELIPHIDSLYPSSRYRVFIGHSLGGLMVVNTLIHHTSLFNSYIAIDPSLSWDQQKLLKQADEILGKKDFAKRMLFLGIANTFYMNPGGDTTKVRKDTGVSSLHIRSILLFVDALKKNAKNGLQWKSSYYADDDHRSVPLITEYDAMHFVFNFNKMPPSILSRLDDSTFNADSAIISRFKDVSKQMDYQVLPQEDLIAVLGYYYLSKKAFSKAYSFFQMNIQNYPNSSDVYNHMGDYYAAKKEKQKAIECYTKAYSMNKSDATKKKLHDLRSAK
jgi:hypothetical protein